MCWRKLSCLLDVLTPKIVPVDGQRFLGLLARLVDHRDAALLAEGRICQDQVVLAVLARERVLGCHGQLRHRRIPADAVQKEVHRAKPGDAVHQFDAEDRTVTQPLLLLPVERVMMGNVVVRRQEEATRAAGRIADRLPRRGEPSRPR